MDDIIFQDMTAHAKRGGFHPIVRRFAELDQVVTHMSKPSGSSVVLKGEPGVGKTSVAVEFVRQVAMGQLMHNERVRVLAVSSDALMSLSTTREIAAKVDIMVEDSKEARARGTKIIFFIDHIDKLYVTPPCGDVPVLEMLRSPLRQGFVQILGTTTHAEYGNTIGRDPGLDRSFVNVQITEPNLPKTHIMLEHSAPGLEIKFGVTIHPKAIDTTVLLAKEYIPGECNPALSIKILHNACGLATAEASADVTEQHGIAAVEQETVYRFQSPNGEDFETAIHLKDRLGCIFGHGEATDSLVGSITGKSLFALGSRRPTPSILLIAPGMTGMAETGRVIAETMFGKRSKALYLNAGDYPHAVDDLVGAYGTGGSGKLTHFVKANPRSVIVVDNFEQAGSELQELFRPICDGTVSDRFTGASISTRQTIIILSTNMCQQHITGLNSDRKISEATRAAVMKDVKSHFDVGLVDRLRVIIFTGPTSDSIQKMLGALRKVARTYEFCQLEWDYSIVQYFTAKVHKEKLLGRDAEALVYKVVLGELTKAVKHEGGDGVPGKRARLVWKAGPVPGDNCAAGEGQIVIRLE